MDLFIKQFTIDDFYDGVEAKHLSRRRSQDSTKELYLSLLKQGWILTEWTSFFILNCFDMETNQKQYQWIPLVGCREVRQWQYIEVGYLVARISFDDTRLNKSMAEINRQMQIVQSEFQKAFERVTRV